MQHGRTYVKLGSSYNLIGFLLLVRMANVHGFRDAFNKRTAYATLCVLVFLVHLLKNAKSLGY
jgi:hypothetical protein